MSGPDVIVIGGGVSGLSVAWRLAQAGISVEVWEQAERPGGKIVTRHEQGYVTEQAASVMMDARAEAAHLCTAAGLDAEKVMCPSPERVHRYMAQNGRLMPFPLRFAALVSSPVWSLRGRLRLLAEPLVPKGGHPGESVSEFIVRRLGREALERAFEPFVAGPLASDPDHASAEAVLPRLVALERRYGSLGLGICTHKFLHGRSAPLRDAFSFRMGMATLIGSLARAPGVCFRPRHTVGQVEPAQTGWRVSGTTPSGERVVRVRHLVVSVPAPAAAKLLRPLDRELADLLRGIDYASLAVVHLGFDRCAVRHPLNGTGFLVPRREGRQITGSQWISSMFPGRTPAGKVLLTSYLGGARAPETRDWDDDRCVGAVTDSLRPLLGIRGTPDKVWVDRHERGLPLYHGAYPGRIRAIAQHLGRWPGLHLAANYWGGISIRDRVTCGYALAQQIAAALQQPKAFELTHPGLCYGVVNMT
ncbi:MAG: protoporphyrinogen oxidase [Betaproteobacteria bacterium]|nr:protoporphyrinogen oxidase [Betaproteobacteria bacterium]